MVVDTQGLFYHLLRFPCPHRAVLGRRDAEEDCDHLSFPEPFCSTWELLRWKEKENRFVLVESGGVYEPGTPEAIERIAKLRSTRPRAEAGHTT